MSREALHGLPGSLGVGVGRSFVVPRPGRALRRRAKDPEREIARLEVAIDESRLEIERAHATFAATESEVSLVLEAQLLLHSDRMFADAASRAVREEGLGAEWAVERTVERLGEPLRRAQARYLRERAEDIAHVGRHLLRHLRGDGELTLPAGEVVLVAADLSPAEAARIFAARGLRGVVLEKGSATSHTALLARALEIPAVVGVRGALDRVISGETVVVDGIRGRVLIGPDDDERSEAEARGGRYREFAQGLLERGAEPVASRDGVEITLRANLELPEEVELALTHGARGVGLYRTEFMLLHRGAAPDEEEQLRVYRQVAEAMAPAPVVFRTFDLGGDKLPPGQRLARAPNPALGLRAMRLLRRRPELLRQQVRALLRAAEHGDVRIMFPMIGGLDELRQARRFVEGCARALDAEGVRHRVPPLGCMVEVPAAALRVERLAREVDFLSVGTNDLVQYMLAVDRTNPEVADVATPLHPAILELLGRIVQGAAGTPLAMCGDMAADPVALPLVLGLGYRSLSVPVGSLPLVAELVRRIDLEDAEALVAAAIDLDDAPSVNALVRGRLASSLGELWREVDA